MSSAITQPVDQTSNKGQRAVYEKEAVDLPILVV
jgi:hypothetical protein